MSVLTAATVVLSAMLALICFSLVGQTVEKNRKEKLRTIRGLKRRADSFRYVLEGFPPNFLGKDLKVLVTKCILEIYQQLAELDPRDKSHSQEIRKIFSDMESLKKMQKSPTRKPLENNQQINEVKHHLAELEKFVAKLYKRKRISKEQAINFTRQLQQLMMQASLDGYKLAANTAKSQGKIRLAIHYYSMAKTQLVNANGNNNFSKMIDEVESTIHKLEKEDAQSSGNKDILDKDARLKGEWDKFEDNTSDASWKKGTLYDR